MDREPTLIATVQRYPCGCEIESAEFSCEHVDAEEERLKGLAWAERNDELIAIEDAKAEARAVLGDEE